MKRIDRRARGRTAPLRLAALDAYLVHAERALLAEGRPGSTAPLLVDLGFGDSPVTTLEAASTLGAASASLRVVGVELDPARAARAVPLGNGWTQFMQGGLDQVLALGPVNAIRAMNVLRAYPAQDAELAHERLGAALIDGGLLLEGSSDPRGHVLVCHLLRRRGGALVREALLFHTDGVGGFHPRRFRDWLPRDLRRDAGPGTRIHAFLSAWSAAWEQARAAGAVTPAGALRASAPLLARAVDGVSPDPWLAERGYLRWAPSGGVPRRGD